MKNLLKFFFVGFLFMVFSCSTNKNTFISRKYHSLTTKYNILHNGKLAYQEGITAINDKYQDDFFNQLPIEPLEFPEKKGVDAPKFNRGGFGGFGGNNKKQQKKKSATPFDKAEEKAAKAIQKHSVLVEGYERNPQIDDAYLLLGKSRYYTQRFVPAIEAFNYIIANYPSANLINETKVWRAKTNIRLENEALAIESLQILLDEKRGGEKLTNKIRESAHTALAIAYMKTDSLQKAIQQLRFSVKTRENKNQAARNLFVLGQIYENRQQKDSAATVFSNLINFEDAPYKYKIRAEIELAKNITENSSSDKTLERLDELIAVRENRPYLDALYYQKGIILEKEGKKELAIKNYNNSLRVEKGDEKQKTYSYNQLGDLYFKDNKYILANTYYDSIIKLSKEDNLRIRRVKRKYKNLASLIKNEELVKVNDSILKIALLPKEEQITYFEEYISKLKESDAVKAQQELNSIAFGNSFGGSSLQNVKQGKWYFYNSQSINLGATEFKNTWGDRKLVDNWRWASVARNASNSSNKEGNEKENSRYNLASYLSSVPTDKNEIDTLKVKRNNALFSLGLIYKEQFINPPLAIKRLERVKLLNENDKKILPIYYNLYELYKTVENVAEQKIHKDFILKNYPETIQAQMVKYPDREINNEEKTNQIEAIYKKAYYLYKDENYLDARELIEETVDEIEDSRLIPKFELLRAFIIGKYKGQKAYRIALEYIAYSYPNTEEGKRALELIKQIKKEDNEK